VDYQKVLHRCLSGPTMEVVLGLNVLVPHGGLEQFKQVLHGFVLPLWKQTLWSFLGCNRIHSWFRFIHEIITAS
jgi:hypothetical protein